MSINHMPTIRVLVWQNEELFFYREDGRLHLPEIPVFESQHDLDDFNESSNFSDNNILTFASRTVGDYAKKNRD